MFFCWLKWIIRIAMERMKTSQFEIDSKTWKVFVYWYHNYFASSILPFLARKITVAIPKEWNGIMRWNWIRNSAGASARHIHSQYFKWMLCKVTRKSNKNKQVFDAMKRNPESNSSEVISRFHHILSALINQRDLVFVFVCYSE